MTTVLCKGRALGGWMAQAARQTSVRRVRLQGAGHRRDAKIAAVVASGLPQRLRLGIVTFKFLRAYDDKGTQQSYAPGE